MFSYFFFRFMLRFAVVASICGFGIFLTAVPNCTSESQCYSQGHVTNFFSWISEKIQSSEWSHTAMFSEHAVAALIYFAIVLIITVMVAFFSQIQVLQKLSTAIKSKLGPAKKLANVPLVIWLSFLALLSIELAETLMTFMAIIWLCILSFFQWSAYQQSGKPNLSKSLYMFPASLSVNLGAFFLLEALFVKGGFGLLSLELFSAKNYSELIFCLGLILALFIFIQDTSEYCAEKMSSQKRGVL